MDAMRLCTPFLDLPEATLRTSDLVDGLHILVLQEGRFWPAVVEFTALEGVFNVSIERSRHNKPIIMARDDILRDSVRRSTF